MTSPATPPAAGEIRPVSSQMVPRFADVATFMRLPRVADPAALDIAVVGVPWDGGTTNRPGARHGPREVRNQSTMIRGVHPVTLRSPFDACRVGDFGDTPVNPVDLQATLRLVEEVFSGLHAAGTRPLAVGGDHLISLPILRAIARDRPVGMVHFDAHTDTWDSYFGGSKYTHGTPFRRAIEEGLLDPRRTIQIGIRGSLYAPDDLAWGVEQGIRLITIDEFDDLGLAGVTREIHRVAGAGPTYVSFDVDGIDPAFTPGTGTPEIGGLSPREAQKMIRVLAGLDLVGADVVEVSPPFDPSGQTALVAANLMFEIVCAMAESLR